MPRASSYANEGASFLDLKERILDLRMNRLEGEKEFIGLRGKELSAETATEIENKHAALLHQLEVEGVQIQREHIQLLRRRFGDIGVGSLGGLDLLAWCPFCEKCVTDCTACVACTHCVIAAP